LMLPWMGL